MSLLLGLSAALSLSLGQNASAATELNAVTGEKQSFAYSWDQEVQMGAEADKEVVEQMGLYDNPQLQAYVNNLGQRLVQVSAFAGGNSPELYRDAKFTFRIIDSTVVNAFALPGGYVYVTRGLLTHVDNEAQLAVVLGHEIGHVEARHSSQQARRNQWGQIGVVLGSILGQKILGEKMPNIGSTILNAGSQATEMFLLRYSREAENEADSLGVAYATRAGYAAGESARFFQALAQISASEGKSLPTWASTHPDPGDRAQHVTQLAASAPRTNRQPIVGTEEYLRQIDGMVVGDDPREGFAQNGIFYHPTLQFQMPIATGWKMDNQKAAVVFAEPNGRATLGLRLAPGSRARDAANRFVQENSLQVVANGDTNINGLPTTVVIAQKDSDKGKVELWDAFIEMDNRVFSLLGSSSEQDFEQFRPTFETVAAGVSPLHDSQAFALQPATLKIIRADRAAPFASFIPTSLPQGLTADEIAIMNQVNMNAQVPSGALLKVPTVSPTPVPMSDPANERYGANDRYGDPNYRDGQNYPANGNYPEQRYPTRDPRYPDRSGYPTPAPQSYPSTSPYPQATYPQSNPPSSNYPQSSYPTSGYPSSSYPSATYPRYPATANPTYPSNGYPSQAYPQQGYGAPQSSSPQFPRPPYSSSQRAPDYSSPTWPR